ncbi:MAG: GspE/PulE family protein [Halofilum sp. (in: g-proteobacteria)]|nr:GspE/PulE family protein [Halofilum sp. (in: g-proteobacteria)]
MALRQKIRLGDLLVRDGLINEEQLKYALEEQKRRGRKLGAALIDLGFVTEDQVLDSLARQLNIERVDLTRFEFDPEVVRKLPETLARRFRAIVLADRGDDILVGMADPTDIFAYDELGRHLKKNISQAVVSESELVRMIDRVYRRTDEISNLAEELGQELSDSDYDIEQLIAAEEESDVPVAKLLKSIFEDAVQVGASDIHIEPDESQLRIRQRVDGVLIEQVMKEKRIAAALVLRLKLLAGLDIAEKRLPQDGRFNIRVKKRSIDVRLSTMPVQHGESVVMRLLDQSGEMLDLHQLGMPDAMVERFRKAVHRPHGLVLVTGPTGSGKTTTLYAALKELNEAGKKIVTAEDPVEYRLPRVNQVQVHTRIGLDFARILRSALRQDPDIMLIGEMRDTETAEIGLRAALTGHMVLSTLHTNDAIGTVDRLLDMGAQGYLVAATLRAVVGQRLLRRVCPSCSTKTELEPAQRAWLEGVLGEQRAAKLTFHAGAGCGHCNRTGYQGRIGVYEMLEPDQAMRTALRNDDIDAFAQAARKTKGYKPLLAGALELAAKGVTTLSEVERIAGEVEDTSRGAGPGKPAAAATADGVTDAEI